MAESGVQIKTLKRTDPDSEWDHKQQALVILAADHDERYGKRQIQKR
jgi:hypothetical protein